MNEPVRTLAALIPVLGRPRNVAPLVRSFFSSVEDEWTGADLVFVCTPGDDEQIAAVRAVGFEPIVVSWKAGPGDYARKINHAVALTDAAWLFTGADDLRFHPGWLHAAISVHIRTGALVVGTNDLHNASVRSGQYATHLLVHRSYLDRAVVDEPGKLFHEGYDHNCVDTELVETAKANGVWAFAKDSHVEHLHPVFRLAQDDATYRKGRKDHMADKQLLQKRRHLWKRRRVAAPSTQMVTPPGQRRPRVVSRWPQR